MKFTPPPQGEKYRYRVIGLSARGVIRRFAVRAATQAELADGILLRGVREVLFINDPAGKAIQ